MGWKDAFNYMRGMAGKHGVDGGQREDDGLPLGARIGSVVTLQQSPLIRANSSGSLIAMPGANGADTRVLAVSQIKLNMTGGLYRYYLAKGDLDAKEKFLQVFRDDQGEIAEIMYCTQLARVVPETAEDQDAYTGVSGYGLGDKTYTLWREQLGDIGLDDADLDLVFGTGDRLDYWRDAGDHDSEFVAPFSGTEVRIDDPTGARGLKQEMYFMPYVRDLADGTPEYLLITTEIIGSVDGDASRRGIHVDFVIGIPVERERLAIQ
ncbi:hypothetical protein [Janthinobacterium agaricidamnosum]|uniref:DUF2491 family protein n=1 Tax=Janthinobacterium agaricidamnosum NBRC 102515 = DSM 9628 TaxID=1349767 RepID=W0VDQ1_9BURK|nr:hypothetical protein [Janthinobacterium agaricidamnosum]CDG86046.1 hypothetical protein GJA_5450 [Janthinobacterium agaricidamnosum NBRC 102515 = DSM 9628]